MRKTLVLSLIALIIIPFILVLPVWPQACAGNFSWPLRGRILRGFEKPKGPYGEGGHQGIDIEAKVGSEVRAAGDGTVSWTGELPRGRFVSISHPGGAKTTYLDLDRIDVTAGQRVKRGQVIGTVNGTRDDSTGKPHLHFGAYLNGSPIDPRLLMSGIDAGDYIRLCPVERRGGIAGGAIEKSVSGPGIFTRIKNVFKSIVSKATSPLKGIFNALRSGTTTIVRVVVAGVKGAWRGLCYIARMAKQAILWVWHNRWVQAFVAAVCAVIVVIAIVVIGAVIVGASLFAAIVAAIVGSIAAIGTCIYVAIVHPGGNIFLSCFLAGVTVGTSVGLFAVCGGALAGAIMQGFASTGIGVLAGEGLKSAFISVVFEGFKCVAFGNKFSWGNFVTAFLIGFFAGGVGKLVKEGMLSIAKEGVITIGMRIAHLGVTGGIGVIVDLTSCKIAGRPFTWSAFLASFTAGAVMGAISLAFDGKGIGGILEKFRFYREKLGNLGREIVRRIASKLISRGIRNSVEKGTERIIGKKEVIE